jgi:hypothetical protein
MFQTGCQLAKVNLPLELLQQVFGLFDSEGKGHFIFADFCNVSLMTQGYDFDY